MDRNYNFYAQSMLSQCLVFHMRAHKCTQIKWRFYSVRYFSVWILCSFFLLTVGRPSIRTMKCVFQEGLCECMHVLLIFKWKANSMYWLFLCCCCCCVRLRIIKWLLCAKTADKIVYKSIVSILCCRRHQCYYY